MSQAIIHDQGYRRFEGERRGVAASMWSLVVHAIQRALGIKRQFRSKVMPLIVFAIVYLTAVIFVGLAFFLKSFDIGDAGFSYGDFASTAGFAVLLFIAFAAPEVICADRKSGMLSLYLASPLTRTTYLAAKALGVFLVLLTVTLGPQLVLLFGYTMAGTGPGGVGKFVEAFGRAILAGSVGALMPTALSIGVSSVTPKRAFASAGIAVGLLASNGVIAGLTSHEGAGADARLGVFNLFYIPIELAVRILGERSDTAPWNELATGWLVLANAVWTVIFGAMAWFAYQRVSVDR